MTLSSSETRMGAIERLHVPLGSGAGDASGGARCCALPLRGVTTDPFWRMSVPPGGYRATRNAADAGKDLLWPAPDQGVLPE